VPFGLWKLSSILCYWNIALNLVQKGFFLHFQASWNVQFGWAIMINDKIENMGTEILASLGLTLTEVLINEELASDPDCVAYLSGSLVEGYGNSSSDIDIFVITDKQPSGSMVLNKDNFAISIHYKNERRIDFEFWPERHIYNLSEKLRVINVGLDFVAEKLSPNDELFIHRLFIGLPLVNQERFDVIKNKFDIQKFRGYLTQQAIHRLDGAFEDISGLLADKDWETLLLRARDIVCIAVDAYTYHSGNTNTLPKWRARILRSLTDKEKCGEVLEDFWRLAFPNAALLLANPSSVHDYARDCSIFAEDIVRWIQK